MARFISYEKLPKKKQHELDRQKRGSWNGVNPVTRKPKDSKVYNRQKAQSWKKDNSDALLFFLYNVNKPDYVIVLQGAPGRVCHISYFM